MLVGSDAPIDVSAIRAATGLRGATEPAITAADVTTFVADARVLTDDYAPVDQLITQP